MTARGNPRWRNHLRSFAAGAIGIAGVLLVLGDSWTEAILKGLGFALIFTALQPILARPPRAEALSLARFLLAGLGFALLFLGDDATITPGGIALAAATAAAGTTIAVAIWLVWRRRRQPGRPGSSEPAA